MIETTMLDVLAWTVIAVVAAATAGGLGYCVWLMVEELRHDPDGLLFVTVLVVSVPTIIAFAWALTRVSAIE